MVWGKAGSTTLSSSGDDLDITSMTASTFNQFMIHKITSGDSGLTQTLNNNTNSVYARRKSANGATDFTATSEANVNSSDTTTTDMFIVEYVCSISGEEKLGIKNYMDYGATGAGSSPDRMEIVYKFVPSPDADITRIDFTNGNSGSYDTDSNISALGSDLTPAAAIPAVDNVQDNSLFIEPSTARRYWFDEGLAPTFEDDFDYATQSAADAVWVPNTTNIDVNVSTDVLDINNVGTLTTNISCVCDLGTISDTKWVLRYKVNWSTLSVGERYAQTFVGLSDKNGTVAWDGSQDSISVLYNRWGLFKQQNSVAASMQDWLLGSDMTDMSVSTDYYVETIRDGTSVSYTAYSDSAYSVPVSGISGTVTLNGNPTGLQYFVIRNDTTSGTGTTAGIIDDFEFYNGVTSATPDTWTMEPTFEDDFSSDNFTDSGANVAVSGGVMNFDIDRATTDQSSYYDLGSALSDTKWIMRLHDVKVTTKSGGVEVFIGVSSNTSGGATAQDFIGLNLGDQTASLVLGGVDSDGAGIIRINADYTYLINTSYYVEIIRESATSYKINVFSDSGFSTSLFSQSYTCTATTTELQYVKFANAQVAGSTESLIGTCTKLEIYNGVTTIN